MERYLTFCGYTLENTILLPMSTVHAWNQEDQGGHGMEIRSAETNSRHVAICLGFWLVNIRDCMRKWWVFGWVVVGCWFRGLSLYIDTEIIKYGIWSNLIDIYASSANVRSRCRNSLETSGMLILIKTRSIDKRRSHLYPPHKRVWACIILK